MSPFVTIIVIGAVCYLLTCLAIFDIARRDFESFHQKVLWIFVAAIPFVGFLIYLVFGRRKKSAPKAPTLEGQE